MVDTVQKTEGATVCVHAAWCLQCPVETLISQEHTGPRSVEEAAEIPVSQTQGRVDSSGEDAGTDHRDSQGDSSCDAQSADTGTHQRGGQGEFFATMHCRRDCARARSAGPGTDCRGEKMTDAS